MENGTNVRRNEGTRLLVHNTCSCAAPYKKKKKNPSHEVQSLGSAVINNLLTTTSDSTSPDFPPSLFLVLSISCVRKSACFESRCPWLASQLVHLKAMLLWDKLLHISELQLPHGQSPKVPCLGDCCGCSVRQMCSKCTADIGAFLPIPSARHKEGLGKKLS